MADQLVPQIAEPTIEAVNQSLISLTESMQSMDSVVTNTQSVRQQLMTKFLPDVLNLDMKVDPGTDPDMYASQARFLSEYRGLLNDLDTSSRNHVNMKLKQKDSETNAAHAINAAEFLSKIKLSRGVPVSNLPFTKSEAEVEALIEKQFEENGCMVLDTELETGQNQLPDKPDNEKI